MKKIFLTIILTALICFQSSVAPMAKPKSSGINNTLIEKYNTSKVNILSVGEHKDTYLFQSYDENSTQGYNTKVNIDGNDYLMRIRQAKLETYNSGYILNPKPIMTLSIGATKKVSETISSTQSSSIVRSVGTKFSFDISFYVTIKTETDFRWTGTKSYSITNTISKDTSYSFPTTPEFKDCNSVTFYSAFDHDKYNLVIDYVPIERGKLSYKIIDLIPPGVIDPNLPEPFYLVEDSNGNRFPMRYTEDIEIINNEKYIVEYGNPTPNYSKKIVDYVDYLLPIPIEYAVGRKI